MLQRIDDIERLGKSRTFVGLPELPGIPGFHSLVFEPREIVRRGWRRQRPGGYGGYSICHDILTGGSNFHTMSESFYIIDFKR
jgi:hypothetical protein